MATLADLGLAEPSTITKNLAVIPITRNSSVQHQEIMSIGSPNSTGTLGLAEVLGTAPQSTVVGLAVRIVSGPSTATDFSVRTLLSSTQADNLVTVYQSTAAALQVTARLNTSSGGAVEGSTGNPATDALGLHIRTIRPQLLTAASTAGSDTLAVVVAGSSAAGTGRIFVSAFTVTSTMAGPVNCGFYSAAGGASTLLWPMTLWADGGVVHHSQAVSGPGYLFATSTGSTLTFQVASTGAYRFGVTYSTGV